jgi:hypothetical protein
MESMHRGILTHRIPVEGMGGAFFALGVATIFWLGVPAFRPLVLLSLATGTLLAPVLFYRRHH